MHPRNLRLAVVLISSGELTKGWTSGFHVLNLSLVEAGDSILIAVHALDVVMWTLSA